MTRLYLSLFLLVLGANAAEYGLVKKNSESYRLFLKEFEEHTQKHKKLEPTPGSDGDHIHRAVAYMLMGDTTNSRREYKLIEPESITTLPFPIKQYLLDVQLDIGAYDELLRSVTVGECLQTKTLKQRKACRYYLGVARFLKDEQKDKNFAYASYYFPALKKLNGENK